MDLVKVQGLETKRVQEMVKVKVLAQPRVKEWG
jgi:hypothetical protein